MLGRGMEGSEHGLLHRSGHFALKPVPFVKPMLRNFATSLVIRSFVSFGSFVRSSHLVLARVSAQRQSIP